MKARFLGYFMLIVCLASCSNSKNNQQKESQTVDKFSTVVKYAKGFSLKKQEGMILLDIHDPQKEKSKSYHFALINRNSNVKIPAGYKPIEIPIKRAICMTSLQLSNFIKLEALNNVVGITSTKHLFNKEIKQRISEGKTVQIGIEGNFDNEIVMSLNPDLIFISPFKRGGYETITQIGVPLIPHLGYKEMSPLGQAEWVKLIGLFVDKENEADNLFREIEIKYNQLKKLTEKVEKRPTVFSGEIKGGNWYAVGGKSFLAEIFHDAGADYFLKNDPHSGGVTFDFEVIYSKAANIDYWRIVNSFNGTFSYSSLLSEDNRYSDFKAFKDKKVLYCNMKEQPYYEQMPMEPEVLLADLIHIFHPQLIPNYKPVYYKLLK